MLGAKQFLVNFATQFGASIINAAFSLVFTAYAAQKLGVVTFGKFSLVQVFVLSFAAITDLGLNNVIIREVAQNKNRTEYIFNCIITIKLILGIMTYAATILFADAMKYDITTRYFIAIYALSVIAVSINNGIISIFNGHEIMIYSSTISLGNAIGYILCIAIIYLGYELPLVFATLTISIFMTSLMGFLLLKVRLQIRIRPQINRYLWKKYLIAGIPFGIISILNMIGLSAGLIMLSHFGGEIEVGYFNTANKIANIFMFFIGAYNAAVYPLFSRLQNDAQAALYQAYQLSTKLMLVIGISAAITLTIISEKMILLIFPSYVSSIPILQVLSWFSLSALLATVTMNILYSEGRQREASTIVLLSAVASLIVDVVLVPHYKAVGVGLGLIVFAILQYILSYIKISKKYPLNIRELLFKSLLIAACVGCVELLFLKFGTFIIVVSGSSIFFLMVIALKVFNEKERHFLLSILTLITKPKTKQEPAIIQ